MKKWKRWGAFFLILGLTGCKEKQSEEILVQFKEITSIPMETEEGTVEKVIHPGDGFVVDSKEAIVEENGSYYLHFIYDAPYGSEIELKLDLGKKLSEEEYDLVTVKPWEE